MNRLVQRRVEFQRTVDWADWRLWSHLHPSLWPAEAVRAFAAGIPELERDMDYDDPSGLALVALVERRLGVRWVPTPRADEEGSTEIH